MSDIREAIDRDPGPQGDVGKHLAHRWGASATFPSSTLFGGGTWRPCRSHRQIAHGSLRSSPGIVDTSLETGKPELKVYIQAGKGGGPGHQHLDDRRSGQLPHRGTVDVTKSRTGPGTALRRPGAPRPQDRAVPRTSGSMCAPGRPASGRFPIIRIDVEGGGHNIINRVDRQKAIVCQPGAGLWARPSGAQRHQRGILPAGSRGALQGSGGRHGGILSVPEVFAIFLGVVMAYMVLASQFELPVHPFTVLLSMPLSFIRAFRALLVTGKTLNVFSFIGLILLMGLREKERHPARGLCQHPRRGTPAYRSFLRPTRDRGR